MTMREKEDLTGAALVALMRLSFAEQGIAMPADAVTASPNRPHASLAGKTALAEGILARHGPLALLRVGQSVRRMGFDPIGGALLAATHGPDLIRRWCRLERYLHTRHPIAVLDVSADSAVLLHRRDPADLPSAAMDFVLAGVFAGLLQAVGCSALSVMMGEGRGAVEVIRDGAPRGWPGDGPAPTGAWRFAWQSTNVATPPSPPLFGPPDQRFGRLTREVIARIEADLVASPSLGDLARSLGQSARTLQRRLAEDGLSLLAIRRAAQIRKASAMLVEGKASLTAIGFATGFADAAHFARAFRAATGISPAAFREAAGPPKPALARGARSARD